MLYTITENQSASMPQMHTGDFVRTITGPLEEMFEADSTIPEEELKGCMDSVFVSETESLLRQEDMTFNQVEYVPGY